MVLFWTAVIGLATAVIKLATEVVKLVIVVLDKAKKQPNKNPLTLAGSRGLSL